MLQWFDVQMSERKRDITAFSLKGSEVPLYKSAVMHNVCCFCKYGTVTELVTCMHSQILCLDIFALVFHRKESKQLE